MISEWTHHSSKVHDEESGVQKEGTLPSVQFAVSGVSEQLRIFRMVCELLFVSSSLKQQPHHFHMALAGSQMQRGFLHRMDDGIYQSSRLQKHLDQFLVFNDCQASTSAPYVQETKAIPLSLGKGTYRNPPTNPRDVFFEPP